MRRKSLARHRGSPTAYHVCGKSAKDSVGFTVGHGILRCRCGADAANNGGQCRSILLHVACFWAVVARWESFKTAEAKDGVGTRYISKACIGRTTWLAEES